MIKQKIINHFRRLIRNKSVSYFHASYLWICLLLFPFTIKSCKSEVQILSLNIGNLTSDSLNIKLYPKSDYRESTSSYYYADIGNTAALFPTEFNLENNSRPYSIIIANDINAKPLSLLNEVFDSILVRPVHDDSLTIKFSLDTCINYEVNPFIDSEIWSYEYLKYQGPEAGYGRRDVYYESAYTFNMDL